MGSLGLFFGIFAGVHALASIYNAIKLTYFDRMKGTPSYSGFGESWYAKARKEGWLRDGRDTNCLLALKCAIICAAGMWLWGGQPISHFGEVFIVIASVFAILYGFIIAVTEDGYSVFSLTCRIGGLAAIITVLIV